MQYNKDLKNLIKNILFFNKVNVKENDEQLNMNTSSCADYYSSMFIENDKDDINTNFNDHTNPSNTTGKS
jgi:hypothetical protein